MNWLSCIASGALGGLASVLLRMAALQSVKPGASFMEAWTPWLFRGGALAAYGAGFVLYALALRRVNLGSAYPLMVAISILVVLAFTALHEQSLKPVQIIGALVILAGVWLVMRSA